ncbi:hypothetical protein KR222_005553 [Zaprionus bogoriensis]|nr:hypothetical protein KR222_005553 [Zaprionus bogoriensis]
MEALLKYRYSFLAGTCAAGGSFLGKLPSFLTALHFLHSTDGFSIVGKCKCRVPTKHNRHSQMYLRPEFAVVHLLPLGLMLCCNVCNLRYFLKALQTTQQTLTATVLTAASNYVLSFVLGALVYREPLTSLTGVGLTFLLAGLWFLCDTSTAGEAPTAEKSKQL